MRHSGNQATGHFLTKSGKQAVITCPTNSFPKIEVGLFRMESPLPYWAWEHIDYQRLLDWVTEPIAHWWYERKQLGRLRKPRCDCAINPTTKDAVWTVEGREQRFDGAFFVTKKNEQLLSVDVFQYPIYSGHGQRLTYAIGDMYIIR